MDLDCLLWCVVMRLGRLRMLVAVDDQGIGFPVIEEAIDLILNEKIVEYRYDSSKGSIIPRA